MRVHLIKSSEVDDRFLHSVISLININRGPVEFCAADHDVDWDEVDLKEIDWDEEGYYRKGDVVFESCLAMPDELPEYLDWVDIFDKTAAHRKDHQIPEKELVVILTEHANEHNWFSAGSPDGRLDFFVQTGMWDRFLDCDPRFPVVYELISIPLQLEMFGGYASLVKHAHKTSRGCINDFCEDKRNVVMKLRTVDICQDCIDLIVKEKVDPALVSQVTKTLESIRSPMLFRERYKITLQPSRLEIRGWNYRLFLTDLGDLKVPLSPMERAVYLLVLNHPEGILNAYFPDHKDELYTYYKRTSKDGSVAMLKERVVAIAENHDGLLNQIISRIRSKLIDLLGDDMAKHYIIQGGANQKRRIELGRGMVMKGDKV